MAGTKILVPPKLKLKHLRDVRVEMAFVYRQLKHDQLTANKAKQQAYILRMVAETIKDIEDRTHDGDNWTNQLTIYGMEEGAI